MNRQEIGSLVSKIIGVYCFVQTAMMLNGPLQAITVGLLGGSRSMPFGYIGMSFFPLATMGFLGCFFFFASASVAGFFLPDHGRLPDEEEKGAPVSLRDFQAVAFSIVGLVVIFWSIRGFSTMLGSSYLIYSQMNMGRMASMISLTMLIPSVCWFLVLVLGLWLFLKGTSLSNFWFRIRRAGILAKEQKENYEENEE